MRAFKPILVSLALCLLLIYSFYNLPSEIIESELNDERFFASRALRVEDVCRLGRLNFSFSWKIDFCNPFSESIGQIKHDLENFFLAQPFPGEMGLKF